jgi:hypothetical protein
LGETLSLLGFWRKQQAPPAMTLEGVLGPNNRLEDAKGFATPSPDAICVDRDNRLLFTSGSVVRLLHEWGDDAQSWAQFPQPVTALCASPAGDVAIGLAGGALRVCDSQSRVSSNWAAPEMASIIDGLFLSDTELVLVDCGYSTDEPFLSLAPWDDVGRGKVVLARRDGETRVLASGLFCPTGVSLDTRGDIIVAEFERARIVDLTGKVRASGYPGYVGRVCKTSSGYVMSCWMRRDPLIEFLRTERRFVEEMKATIAPRHWIAPRLSPEFRHDFPIEAGATRLFGEIKPWAPSFSYGLLLELDKDLTPIGAAHSRANGRRHAMSDALVWNGELIAVSKASEEILNLGRLGEAR